MPVHNADIAAIFTEIADLLEIEQANPFRVRAYRNAARIVGDLLHVPGLGPKRVRTLWHDLDVQTLEQLARAAREGRSRTRQTERILRAMDHPRFTLLAHPTGRLLESRLEAADVLNKRPLGELRRLLAGARS